VVLQNLDLAYGDEISRPRKKQITRENFCHYGKLLIEIICSIAWNKKAYLKNVTFEGFENVETWLAQGQGGFFLSAHLGNWELAVGSVAAAGVPLDIVVKRSPNPRIEALQQWYRKNMGVGVFVETGTAKDILRSLSKGRWVAFINDQFMGPPIGLPVTFYGKLAGTAVALALLTEKKNVPVIPAYCYRDAHGRLFTRFEKAIEWTHLSDDKITRLYQKTQVFNDILERIVRQHPEQWLWLHRRWKRYSGNPRWELPDNFTLAIFIFLALVFGTANLRAEEPTLIPIPPDPAFVVPKFKLPADPDAKVPAKIAVPLPVTITSPELKNVFKSKKSISKEEGPILVTGRENEPFGVLDPQTIGFEEGERQEIELTFLALTAGRAVLEVRPGALVQGRTALHFWGNVLSSKLVDALYHVDNTIESVVDRQALIPYKFLLHMVETNQKKETRVVFDHVKKKAFYWSKRLSQRWGDETKDRSDDLTPGSRDMFSALYYARTLDYEVNKKASIAVFENGKNYNIELTPVAIELVRSRVGIFQCFKIKVTINLGNVLASAGEMFLWLSADSKKYVVKFDAKLKIGSLKGNLVAIRDHT
jgi:KDO2-lipid IV(A) lauroyltransferase